MGEPISVVLSDIYFCKMEEGIVAPSMPLFYKRSVDDTYARRKKNWNWWTLQCIELVAPKYKTELRNESYQVSWYRDCWSNSKITTEVHNEMKILPVHSISKIPVIYKRNGIIGELHRAKKIASNFDIQIKSNINGYRGARFFSRLARSIIDHYRSFWSQFDGMKTKTKIANLNQLII